MFSSFQCQRCGKQLERDAVGLLCPDCRSSGPTPETPANQRDETPLSSRTAAMAPPTADDSTVSLAIPRLQPIQGKPPHISGFDFLGKLGAGGNGCVYLAKSTVTEEFVAIKILNENSSVDIARFNREIATMRLLRHPNIVEIYEFGETEDDRSPFYTMAYMKGESLSRLIHRQGKLNQLSAARIVSLIAKALEFAHRHKTLHRDIKPGNILLTEDGDPKLADFGLAKLTYADTDDSTIEQLTGTKAFIGTPPYMSPEQAACRHHDVDTRSDVYSLGAVLYHLLTGEPPFTGASPPEIAHRVIHETVIEPRVRDKSIAMELEAICLKCLMKSPEQRYQSAAELAEELDRWIAGQKTIVRPPSRVSRLRKWINRHQQFSVATACAVLVLSSALLFQYYGPWSTLNAQITNQEKEDPESELKKIAQELETKGEAILLGETGLPRWSRWDVGGSRFSKSTLGKDYCSVNSEEEEFIELIPEKFVPQKFRLKIDMIHEVAFRDHARAGFYFAKRTRDLGNSNELTTWFAVEFNEFHGVPDSRNPKNQVVAINLTPFVLLQQLNKICIPNDEPLRSVHTPLMKNPEIETPPWHTIIIESSLDELIAKHSMPGMAEAAFSHPQMSMNTIRQSIVRMRDEEFAKAKIDASQLQSDENYFSGSIGLYVRYGRASFKNVVLQDLSRK